MSEYEDIPEEEEEELDLSDSKVVTKYKAAAEITNQALKLVIDLCKPGAKVLDICKAGDEFLTEETGKVFNKGPKKDIPEKGIAFPTCLSINNVVCHFSPQDDDTTVIAEGDMVKIDLGCHIDGFVATSAHTIVAQADMSKPVTGKAADVMAAAHTAGEALLRMIRPGKDNQAIPPILEKIAEAYGVSVLEGVLTHQTKRFVIDGNKVVLNKPCPEYRAEEQEFEENEVYCIDIAMSTGEGKAKVQDERQTSVYKRSLDREYHLKMKASRAVLSDVNKKFPTMPFTSRSLDCGKRSEIRLGLVECVNHELLAQYPVLHEKEGELVAHFKATVLLMPNGSDRITGAELQAVESDKKIEDEEVQAVLASAYKKAKKKKNKK